MRKRKQHDSRVIPLGALAVALGLLLLGGFSVFGVWQLANIPPTRTDLPTPFPSNIPDATLPPPYPTDMPPPTYTPPPRPYPTLTPLPPPPLLIPPTTGRIAHSSVRPKVIGFIDATGGHAIDQIGDEIALAPDGQTLAFTRDGKLYVFTKDYKVILVADRARLPAWNGDGTALTYVVYGTDNTQAIYQLQLGKTQAVRLWVSQRPIIAPPQPVPGRKKLLIVELIAQDKTAFYTIDSTCLSYDACLSTRREIATVPFTVTWADYHPSGTFIGFTELNGKLYQLTTAEGKQEIKLLVDDSVDKRSVAFSQDGTSLVYVSRVNELFMVQLENPPAAKWLLQTDVVNVDWAGK